MVQHVHWNGIHHGDTAPVVLEDEHHVKILQVELDTLKVHQLHVLQCDHERRLNIKTFFRKSIGFTDQIK